MHQAPVSASKPAVRTPLYYQCPMHPSYRSDRPGDAPCCGMKLVPVYAETGAVKAPGTIRISAEKQQMIGLATVQARRRSATGTVRVLGRVVPDETRVHRITALADGVVRAVSPYGVGSVVPKDAMLATYYVSMPEVYSAIQSYFVAMNALEQGLALSNNPGIADQANAQIRVSQELLKTYGLSETQLKEMARTRQATRDIDFRSPVSGVVLARNLGLGQRAAKGDEIFRIADLSRVWILADVFENDGGLVRPGMAARVVYRGRAYRASMGEALPRFDAASRTLKVRLELENPDFSLRPDMFVDVEFDVRQPEGISVPVDAVLDSGVRKTVFVKNGEGAFESRDVTTGVRFGDQVQIASGLKDGEEVVVSGMFLLDSESRLKRASTASADPGSATSMGVMPGVQTDPVCGMAVDAKSTLTSEYRGSTYRFCSKGCKEKFDGDRARYAKTGGQS